MSALAYNLYKTQSVMTANRGELALMLYNGCIKFTSRAVMAIDEGNMQGAHDCLIRAQLILEELMSSLDMSHGMSARFMQLYEYFHSRLVEANIKKDAKILGEVLPLITEIRDAWEQALESLKRGAQ